MTLRLTLIRFTLFLAGCGTTLYCHKIGDDGSHPIGDKWTLDEIEEFYGSLFFLGLSQYGLLQPPQRFGGLWSMVTVT